MNFKEFHDQLVYELVFSNGMVMRGPMQNLTKHIKDYACGCTFKVADDFWQPANIKSIVSGWKNCGCDCTIEEYFQSIGGDCDACQQVPTEDI